MFNRLIKSIYRLRKSGVMSRSTIGVCIVNIIFQRFFGISRRFPYQVHFTSKITAPAKVVIKGNEFELYKCLALNGGILIQGSNGVDIDSSVLIAPGVKIISGNHDLNNFFSEAVFDNKIEIHQYCWIGANSVILPGVVLKKGTIVGAGSVVVKSFNDEDIVIAGNPAKVIKSY
jgi:acetyltransferase-like isoleucine patch superfamily enzyme